MDRKMFVLLSCIFFCSYAVGLPENDSQQAITVRKCGTSILPPSSPDRIVGGNVALHGQHPWMISLQLNGRHHCGASVLNENWIITAAHCISYPDRPGWYRVLAGLHKLSQEYASTVQRIEVSKILVHEKYYRTADGYDIALIKTAKPINIAGSRGYVNGICLPNTDNDPKGYGKISGWGHTTEGGVKSDTLREVALPIVPRSTCNNAYDSNPYDAYDYVLPTMLCAGIAGKDSCQADSGGPLIQTDSNGVSTLIGLVSFGRGCGRQFYPGINTKVSSYLRWIENNIARN